MKRLYIVVEGQTEQEFVNELMAPYLQDSGIYSVTPVLIHTSRSGRGGMVNYQHLYNTIKILLCSANTDFVVTTFIDFFRLPNTMPDYAQCMAITDKIQCVSNNKGFEYYFSEAYAQKTAAIISSYANPEDINTSPQGAPSKRILAIKPDYNKVIEGNLIALEIGINTILDKCPRFAAWVSRIVDSCKD